MSGVQGVETNESSRFIDHTQATPWETLIADIEKALKLLSKSQNKVEINYLEMGLTIEKMKANSNRNKKDVSKSLSIHDSLWLSKTFNARTYLLFSCTGPASVDYPISLRMTILSAFVTAVKTIGTALSLPVFFTYSVVSDVGQIKELVGYQLFNKSITPKEKELRYCRYESFLYDKISTKHHLYFFDGIRKIFYKKLSLIANPLLGDVQQQVANLAENYRVTAMNSYLYKMGDYKQLLSEPPHYGDAEVPTNSRTVFSGDFNKLLIYLCSQNLTKSLHLSHILIKLQYKEQKQTSVIDNDAYSTFIPSKQPPSSWKISSYFRVSSSALKIDTISAAAAQAVNALIGHANMNSDYASILPSTTTSCWMAYSIRRLLAFYIASIYNKSELLNMDKLANHKYLNNELLERNTVDKVIVMLSIESQNTFRNMFINTPSMPTDFNKTNDTRDRSQSTPSPHHTGDDEEWMEQESYEPIREIMNFLFETEDVKLRKARAGSRATTEDGYGTSTRSEAVNFTEPMLNYSINRAVGINLSNVVAAAASASDCQSDSIGYFMSLFSVLSSCMNGAGTTGQSDIFSLAKLWNNVLKETHNSWEFGNTLKTFIPVLGENSPMSSLDYGGSSENLHSLAGGRSHAPPNLLSSPTSPAHHQSQSSGLLPPRSHHQYGTYAKYLMSTSTSILSNDENKLPICARQLWQDLIDKKKVREGLHIALPDRSETLVIQKLQLLQFCIAMKNESVIYRFRNNVSPTPPGGDKAIISPRLYRRLPLTEDAIEMQERISRKVSNDSSKSGKDHPLLKWQVVMPALISDLNAFKAANTGADLAAFINWYGVTVSPEATSSRPSTVASTPVQSTRKTVSSSNNNNNSLNDLLMENPLPDSNALHTTSSMASIPSVGSAIELEGEGELTVTPSLDTALDSVDNLSPMTPTVDHTIGIAVTSTAAGPMTSLGIPYSTLVEIWNICEGIHCETQKPLFQAEKEAEKSLAYLEKIPFTQFTCTLLSNAVKFVFHLLNVKLNHWIAVSGTAPLPTSPVNTGNETPTHTRHRSKGSFSGAMSENMTTNLMSDLMLLQEQIDNAIRLLKTQSTQTVREESSTSAIIILIDSIAGLVEKLENVCLKADEIDALFRATMATAANSIVAATSAGAVRGMSGKHQAPAKDTHQNAAATAASIKLNDMHRMLVSLALRDNYFVEREEEVAAMMDFIKVLNMQTDTNGPQGVHAWHSYDGRELGLPTSKSYSLRVAASVPTPVNASSGSAAPSTYASPNIANISGKHFVTLSAASRTESNDFTRNNSDGESPVPMPQQEAPTSQKIVSDFQMDAVIQQNVMRISFRIPESE